MRVRGWHDCDSTWLLGRQQGWYNVALDVRVKAATPVWNATAASHFSKVGRDNQCDNRRRGAVAG